MIKYLIFVMCGCGLLPSFSLLFLGGALFIGAMELVDRVDCTEVVIREERSGSSNDV